MKGLSPAKDMIAEKSVLMIFVSFWPKNKISLVESMTFETLSIFLTGYYFHMPKVCVTLQFGD